MNLRECKWIITDLYEFLHESQQFYLQFISEFAWTYELTLMDLYRFIWIICK
jgi:hypothetical protein